MNTVLDLDLDFFVWPIAYRRVRGRLPDGECRHLASEPDVRQFLEQRCHLQRPASIPGVDFVEHDEAFRVWRRWLKEGTLSNPFRVIHVDGHADLGLWDASYLYIQVELLAFPPGRRWRPGRGPNKLNPGNYLAFAIACRWIRDLTLVYPTDPSCHVTWKPNQHPPDLQRMIFKDHDVGTRVIQLARYRPEDRSHLAAHTKCPQPVSIEPIVPVDWKPVGDFEFAGFTHIVVAQSPKYTPKSADHLLPVIREYFTPA